MLCDASVGRALVYCVAMPSSKVSETTVWAALAEAAVAASSAIARSTIRPASREIG